MHEAGSRGSEARIVGVPLNSKNERIVLPVELRLGSSDVFELSSLPDTKANPRECSEEMQELSAKLEEALRPSPECQSDNQSDRWLASRSMSSP
jgi:hypothetical protein